MKKLLILLIGLCFLYPAVELTRVITLSWEYYGLLPELWMEIAFIWIGYVAGMILVGGLLWKRKWKKQSVSWLLHPTKHVRITNKAEKIGEKLGTSIHVMGRKNVTVVGTILYGH